MQPERSGRLSSSQTIRLVPFERVVHEHGGAVWRFCASQVGRELADDLFQETLVAALSAYPALREPGRVRSWLLRIAARKAVDHYRERNRAPVPVAEPDAGVAAQAEPVLPDDDLWAWVRALPPKQRQAIALRFVADLAYADIGEAMETSVEAARRNVFEGSGRCAGAWPHAAPTDGSRTRGHHGEYRRPPPRTKVARADRPAGRCLGAAAGTTGRARRA